MVSWRLARLVIIVIFLVTAVPQSSIAVERWKPALVEGWIALHNIGVAGSFFDRGGKGANVTTIKANEVLTANRDINVHPTLGSLRQTIRRIPKGRSVRI